MSSNIPGNIALYRAASMIHSRDEVLATSGSASGHSRDSC